MPVTIEIEDRLFEISALLPGAIDGVAEHAANTLYTAAVAGSPVLTGDMRDSHLIEKVGDHWEVSVQKEAAQNGEKTYAWLVNDGTVHQAAQPWFTNAAITAGDELQMLTSLGGIL